MGVDAGSPWLIGGGMKRDERAKGWVSDASSFLTPPEKSLRLRIGGGRKIRGK